MNQPFRDFCWFPETKQTPFSKKSTEEQARVSWLRIKNRNTKKEKKKGREESGRRRK